MGDGAPCRFFSEGEGVSGGFDLRYARYDIGSCGRGDVSCCRFVWLEDCDSCMADGFNPGAADSTLKGGDVGQNRSTSSNNC